jgi:hypothetical protein
MVRIRFPPAERPVRTRRHGGESTSGEANVVPPSAGWSPRPIRTNPVTVGAPVYAIGTSNDASAKQARDIQLTQFAIGRVV